MSYVKLSTFPRKQTLPAGTPDIKASDYVDGRMADWISKGRRPEDLEEYKNKRPALPTTHVRK